MHRYFGSVGALCGFAQRTNCSGDTISIQHRHLNVRQNQSKAARRIGGEQFHRLLSVRDAPCLETGLVQQFPPNFIVELVVLHQKNSSSRGKSRGCLTALCREKRGLPFSEPKVKSDCEAGSLVDAALHPGASIHHLYDGKPLRCSAPGLPESRRPVQMAGIVCAGIPLLYRCRCPLAMNSMQLTPPWLESFCSAERVICPPLPVHLTVLDMRLSKICSSCVESPHTASFCTSVRSVIRWYSSTSSRWAQWRSVTVYSPGRGAIAFLVRENAGGIVPLN